jgi:beta-phosphoglucomutase-like phosphatase (HAD superfamily)
MTYKAVLFDLDGTLVHTIPEHRYQTVGQALKDLGVATSNKIIDKLWFGARRDEAIKEYFGLEPELFWTTFRRYDTIEKRREFTKPYDDIGFIGELRQRGYKTGIVTGAPRHIASLEIGMIGEKNFDAIILAQSLNGFKPKPHPEGLLECLKLLGVNNNEAIYVGNADEDIETAINAKVFDVLIERGECEFPNINPSLRIHSLYGLKPMLGLAS